MSIEDRWKLLKEKFGLEDKDIDYLRSGGLDIDLAKYMVENVIGLISLPLGVATNFLINGKEYLVPMAIEEPSVIAASSKGAKIARILGGFRAEADEPYMIGQIQVINVRDPLRAASKIMSIKDEVLELANTTSNTLRSLNAGAKDLSYKVLDSMLIVELLVDVRDAMGANIVDSMCEKVAPLIEEVSGGKVLLRILSNYATRRMVRAYARFSKEVLGNDTIDNILEAYRFALLDKYRAVTHNKGIMNGIIAVANALMQDTRAIEASIHAYACNNGYKPLTEWSKDEEGNLVGKIELPLSVGIKGGTISVHPIARTCLKILNVNSSKELACVMASVGLAQNFAALLALVTTGIQKGHMKMHARNIAIAAGAKGELIDIVAKRIYEENNITLTRAKEILQELGYQTQG